MWNLSVPKRIFFYWDDSPLSELHLQTVQTFHHYNPDWKMVVYYPLKKYKGKNKWSTSEQTGYTGANYLDALKSLDYLEWVGVDFNKIGFKNNVSEVHKSDYLRLYILANEGGVWSDMDIFYVNSMDNLQINVPENKDKSTFIVYDKTGEYYSIGFMMSSEKSPFFTNILQVAIKNYDEHYYQCIGSSLYSKVYSVPPEDVVNMNMDIVYPYRWNQINTIFNESVNDRLPESTIGIHWFNGSKIASEYISTHSLNTYSNIFTNKFK